LQKLQTSAKTIKADLSKALDNLKTYEDNSNNLFIASKKAQALLNQLQSSLEDITSKTKYQEYDLKRDPQVETLLKNKEGMAQLVLSPGKRKKISYFDSTRLHVTQFNFIFTSLHEIVQ